LLLDRVAEDFAVTCGWEARGWPKKKKSLGLGKGRERAERRSYTTSLTGIACERGTTVIRDIEIEIDF
jgi:hypothetical protein